MVTTRVHLPVLGGTPAPLPAGGIASGDPLLDGFARRIRYLRISVTDRCNYRCSYCMPEELGEQLSFAPRSAVLSFEELERLVTVFARLGVRKLRLTGGEPTVRKGIVELVRRLRAVPGIEQVVMTSLAEELLREDHPALEQEARQAVIEAFVGLFGYQLVVPAPAP